MAEADPTYRRQDGTRAFGQDADLGTQAAAGARAAQQRADAAKQRALAAEDRLAAARDREEAAHERLRALVDREALARDVLRRRPTP